MNYLEKEKSAVNLYCIVYYVISFGISYVNKAT